MLPYWYMLSAYRIDILRCWRVCSIGAMTFESEIIFCTENKKKKWSIFIFFIVNWVINKGWFKKQYSRIWGVDIMNSYSSFNTSKGKSGRFVHFVFKNSNTAMLNLRKKVFQKLEGQIFWMLFCIETQNTIYNNEK